MKLFPHIISLHLFLRILRQVIFCKLYTYFPQETFIETLAGPHFSIFPLSCGNFLFVRKNCFS